MERVIKQKIVIKCPISKVYEAFVDENEFSKITDGEEADIDPVVGGKFSLFSGKIQGYNLDLIKNKRVVQAWRAMNWSEGVFSITTFTFEEQPKGSTTIFFEHVGFPDGDKEHLEGGWYRMYWDKFKNVLEN